MRSEAPLTVRWASIWAGDQYIAEYGGRLTTSPLSTHLEVDVEARRLLDRAGRAAAAGPGRAAATRASSSAASGVTHGPTDVANDLPRNGPSGTYSQAWMSRADQSLSGATPKTWSVNVGGRHRLPERGRHADDEAELGLDVEPAARAEGRRRVVGGLALPARADDVGARHDDRAGAAVVADRQVPPVRGERLGVGPEDPAHVRGVVQRAVEVDVVGDLERQVHRDLVERDRLSVRHRAESSAAPRATPGAQRHEGVQVAGQHLVEPGDGLRVDDGVAVPYADPRGVARSLLAGGDRHGARLAVDRQPHELPLERPVEIPLIVRVMLEVPDDLARVGIDGQRRVRVQASLVTPGWSLGLTSGAVS